jgi:hypothetical protein
MAPRTIAWVSIAVSLIAAAFFISYCMRHAAAHYAMTEELVRSGALDLEKFSTATGNPAEIADVSRYLDQGYSPRVVKSGFVASATALAAAWLFSRRRTVAQAAELDPPPSTEPQA